MNVWRNQGLAVRVYSLFGILIVMALIGGAITIWYAANTGRMLRTMMEQDVTALQAARELETALVSQKGFLTYYYIDQNPDWLQKLESRKHEFDDALDTAFKHTHTDREQDILIQIRDEYTEYSHSRDQVVKLYKAGRFEEGADLHWKIRLNFFAIHGLAEKYKQIYTNNILDTQSSLRRRAVEMRNFVVAGMALLLSLGIGFGVTLATQVIQPIRRLSAAAAGADGQDGQRENEMKQLSRSVHGLIENVGATKRELEQSREMLEHSEKMALLGKLSTEVAHSIRNPLTSIKMRLFSLQRSLDLNENQKEDIEVVSEEMRRLDNIVRNFLEFSRPPKLKMQSVRISDLMSMTLALLHHRLKIAGVVVERRTQEDLPPVNADPELLKEVLVNFIVNACDAMDDKGGKIRIQEMEAVAEHVGRAVVVRIQDTGPGVPEEIRDRVLEPFFTTKAEGTGLGLSIARRIIEEHGGRIDLSSPDSGGATFSISIPIPEGEESS